MTKLILMLQRIMNYGAALYIKRYISLFWWGFRETAMSLFKKASVEQSRELEHGGYSLSHRFKTAATKTTSDLCVK